jgi:hypothetical protein
MTTQANPPTDAYAHGYVQNAHTQTRALTRLPASHIAHHDPSPQRTTKPLLQPAPPGEVPSIATHEMFMVSELFYRTNYPRLMACVH